MAASGGAGPRAPWPALSFVPVLASSGLAAPSHYQADRPCGHKSQGSRVPPRGPIPLCHLQGLWLWAPWPLNSAPSPARKRRASPHPLRFLGFEENDGHRAARPCEVLSFRDVSPAVWCAGLSWARPLLRVRCLAPGESLQVPG